MCYVGLLSLFCEVHGPVVLMTTITISESIENLLPQIHSELSEDPTSNCEYCQSFQAKTWPCLVSQEHNVTFLSSRSGVYDIKSFKHVCLRCLSCESGDKWMACDNLLNGGVLTYNFRVPDHRARGMHRLCGLSVLAMGLKKQGQAAWSCHSTSILNSSATTNLVFPKLEAMASEMIEKPDIAPVSNDKKKSLAFVHLNFSQLLSSLCLESEEFVKFSPTTANIQMTLNLELLRKWAFNQNGFVPLLTFYFLKKNFKVEVMELSHGQCLRQLLEYFDIPLLQLRNDYHEESCKLQLNNAAAASGSSVLFKVTNESILKNAVADDYLPEDLEMLTYAKKLQTILLEEEADEENDGSDDVITMARLDLHKHTFSSLFSRYSQCCKSAKRIQSFKNAYELSDFDIQWLENGATKR